MTEQTGEVVDRDPDLIQSEIEKTREELAETMGAIADKVSPKRAASRGAAKVKTAAKATVDSVRQRAGQDGSGELETPHWAEPKSIAAGDISGTEMDPELPDPQANRPGPIVTPEQAMESGVPPGQPYRAAPGVIKIAGESTTVLRKGRLAGAAVVVVLVAWYVLRRRSASRS